MARKAKSWLLVPAFLVAMAFGGISLLAVPATSVAQDGDDEECGENEDHYHGDLWEGRTCNVIGCWSCDGICCLERG